MDLGSIYYAVVTQPLLNLLQILENVTHDTGIAIILIGATINLILWPIYHKNYINTQKLRYLQPELDRIQEAFKDRPQEMLFKRAEVLKKHNVTTGTFWIALLQLPFVFSLYQIAGEISNNKELNGIYSFINESGKATFGHKAFGTYALNEISSHIGAVGIFFVILVSLCSLLLALYMFKWAPKPNLPEPPKAKPLFKNSDPNAPDFTQTLQKSIEVQSIYVFPALYFFVNLNLPLGVVLYLLGSTASGLVRQFVISQYYSRHAERLMESIFESDPSLKNSTKESVKVKAEPEVLVDAPIATKVISKKNSKKTAITKKKGKTKRRK